MLLINGEVLELHHVHSAEVFLGIVHFCVVFFVLLRQTPLGLFHCRLENWMLGLRVKKLVLGVLLTASVWVRWIYH